MNESCLTYDWQERLLRIHQSCNTYEWVMSNIRMSHVPYMNESCLTYEWVMSHIRMTGRALKDTPIMQHIWMSHVTHMKESFQNKHITHHPSTKNRMHESCLTHGWVTSHTCEWVMSHMCEWVMSHTCEWVMSHTCERVISHMSHIPHKWAHPMWIMSHANESHIHPTNLLSPKNRFPPPAPLPPPLQGGRVLLRPHLHAHLISGSNLILIVETNLWRSL